MSIAKIIFESENIVLVENGDNLSTDGLFILLDSFGIKEKEESKLVPCFDLAELKRRRSLMLASTHS